MSIDEGYIKFNLNHQVTDIEIPEDIFEALTNRRTDLHKLNLVGETPEGIGFGNISQKYKDGFFITGSATGAKRILNMEGYAFVSSYSFQLNSVDSLGRTNASSESLSHAAIYECNKEINSVIHIHSAELWDKYKNVLPTTSEDIGFGTPEIAMEIKNLLLNVENYNKGIVIMGGHKDGIISFGKTIDEAGEKIKKLIAE